MLKRIFTVLYHFCWYVFAFIVLTAAVLVTVLRLALPEIGGYKDEIQSWVSNYMDYPVVIEEITAEWQGWAPHLYLKNIDLYTPDNNSLISKFDSAHLGIDIFSSINKRELVPSHLSISGLSLKFTRNRDGSISIHDDDDNSNNNSDNSALSEWLLQQKHITIENANLIWYDKKANKEPQQFSNVQLDLKTKKRRLQIEANILLSEKQKQSLTIKMDVTGDILTPEWKGTIYAEAKAVNPANFLNDFPVKSTGGIADARLWSSWDKSKLIDITGEIHYSNFLISTGEYNLNVNNINLNLYAERKQDKNWLLNVTVENLQTEHGVWPISNYQLSAERNNTDDSYRYRGFSSYLKLEEVMPFLVASKLVSNNVLQNIHWQSLKGELINSNFEFNPELNTEEFIRFDTAFKNITIVSYDKNNTVHGLTGSLNATNKLAKIDIHSQSSEVQLDSILDRPLSLSAIDAKLELVNDGTFELLVKKLHIEDKYISVQSSGKIKFYEKDSPLVDIVAHLDQTSIENLPTYLPKQTTPKLSDWFTRALAGGQLLSGDLIYRGHTADFPFDNAEGNFKAILNIENVTLDYAEDWPPIDKVTAEIIIDNNDLYVLSSSAYIFDAFIDGFSTKINDLDSDSPHIVISGTVTGHTSDAANFIVQSPLNKNPSLRVLTENISGGLSLKLNLDIPLDHSETTVDGLISFTDTTIESNLPGLGLEDVNGDVNFTRQATWASNIDALYHGKPVKLDIPKFDQHETDSESYIISGTADKDFFINELTSFFPSIHNISHDMSKDFSGESKWSLTLKKLNSNTTKDSREVVFNSDLKGISINLPSPLGKEKNVVSSLSIKTKFTDLLINEININYDNYIYADFNVDNTKDLIIKNIFIGLGQQYPATQTTSDISIKGELEELNVSDWIDLFNPKNATASQNKSINKKKIINGDVFIKKLNMLGNGFNDVNIKLNNQNEGWQVFFNGEDIKGQANFISSNNSRAHANFEKLTLRESSHDNSEDKNQIAIDKIPELEVNVDEFVYNDNKLGQLNLLTSNIINGIDINNLSITKPGFNIIATGKWMRHDDIDRSDFHATLEADTIETMLGTFGFDANNITGGKTTIEMNAYWMDTPMNFAMEKSDGELDMKIAKGHFLDIEPSAGRLFGLLSLQTLPRRLTLDFSDVFDKGFAFDSIEGSFSLQQGHAYTNDLAMTGPSADIIISGRTGLSTEDYDQIATITPKISSGLPVASALFGPIGVGVGAVIYIAGEIFDAIPKKIDHILSAQYSITGSWDHPNIEKIKEEKDSG